MSRFVNNVKVPALFLISDQVYFSSMLLLILQQWYDCVKSISLRAITLAMWIIRCPVNFQVSSKSSNNSTRFTSYIKSQPRNLYLNKCTPIEIHMSRMPPSVLGQQYDCIKSINNKVMIKHEKNTIRLFSHSMGSNVYVICSFSVSSISFHVQLCPVYFVRYWICFGIFGSRNVTWLPFAPATFEAIARLFWCVWTRSLPGQQIITYNFSANLIKPYWSFDRKRPSLTIEPGSGIGRASKRYSI